MKIATFNPKLDMFYPSFSALQVLSLLVIGAMGITFCLPVLVTEADETSGGATVAVGITLVTAGVVTALAGPVALGVGIAIAGVAVLSAGTRLWEESSS